MAGNVLYTTNDRVIYLNIDTSNNMYLTQKVYTTGVQEFDVLLGPTTSNTFVNLFQEGNGIYASDYNGLVYRINPSNPTVKTLVGSFTASNLEQLGGAAQRSTCITIPINPSSWDGA